MALFLNSGVTNQFQIVVFEAYTGIYIEVSEWQVQAEIARSQCIVCPIIIGVVHIFYQE